MEEKIKNLTFIVILGFIIMFILIIGLYFKDGTTTTETTNKGTSGGSATSDTEYDVSEMNEVDLEEAVALFDEKGTHVLYMGRSACTNCRQFVPVLNEVQAEDYALANTTLFEETNTTYISVDDLIEAGYLAGNESGVLTDPTDSSKNFNDKKVKLEYDEKKNNVTATVVD